MSWPESVYLELGITVAVVDGKVAHLFLYSPTTRKDYDDRLGGADDWVRRR